MKSYVFFDIDGTLLPEGENDIPQKTIESIKKLKENGHEPFICTGRCYHQAKKFIDQIGADSYVVSNGQEANVKGHEVYSYNISKKEKGQLIEKLKASGLNYGYETREKIYLVDMPGAKNVQEKIEGYGNLKPEINSDKINDDIKQMWAFGEHDKITKLEENIIDYFKFFRWSDYSIEIIPRHESKGKAVKKILEHTKEEVKTYAFGDGYNDMELLSVVDVGVAMGNAKLEVKAVSDLVTDNSEDDGITKGLKKLNLI